MRAICLKRVLFAAIYSNILAETAQERPTRMSPSVIYKQGQAWYTSPADLNTDESEGAEGLRVI